MARSLFEAAAREDVTRRMQSIDPTRAPLWGKMNAGRMLSHVNAALAMAVGDLATQPKKTPIANPLGRWLLIYVLPWPKGSPTAPELLETEVGSWSEDMDHFRTLLERFGGMEQAATWPRHPAFGKMSARQWGNLEYRHVDHHLRQFGV